MKVIISKNFMENTIYVKICAGLKEDDLCEIAGMIEDTVDFYLKHKEVMLGIKELNGKDEDITL